MPDTTNPTHVLHWVPAYLVRGSFDGDGWWKLQSLATYDAGEPQLDPDWYIEGEGRDIDAAGYTEWIASMVGWPVTVEKSWTRITCLRALRFRRPEPLFYVSPAGVAA